jgi:hypothetical protein
LKEVVFTGVFGGVESLQERVFEDSSRDYLCFTDDPAIKSRSWQVIYTEPSLPGDPARSVRQVKYLGHPELEGYERRLWIDNKIRLLAPPDAMMQCLGPEDDIAVPLHDHRGSLRAEFDAVRRSRKDAPFRVRELQNYVEMFYPELLDQKIYEQAIIVSRPSDSYFSLMHEWYQLVLRFSARAQLSFSVALSRSDAKLVPLPFGVSGSQYHEFVSGHELNRPPSSRAPFEPALWKVALDTLIGSGPARELRKRFKAFRVRGF